MSVTLECHTCGQSTPEAQGPVCARCRFHSESLAIQQQTLHELQAQNLKHEELAARQLERLTSIQWAVTGGLVTIILILLSVAFNVARFVGPFLNAIR